MNLARPPEKYDATDQARTRGEIERADAGNIKRSASEPFILMSKPDGTVGKLTINSSGNPIWTAL